MVTIPSKTLLEKDFPWDDISRIAQIESWRKEVYKPATHTHKWWARRLGSVFRGIISSSLAENLEEYNEIISGNKKISNYLLYDPFAGSGTTLVEAAKLQLRVIGKDINPVATLVQRQALQTWNKKEIYDAYKTLTEICSEKILSNYKNSNNEIVLYYFWVALANCKKCGKDTELFTNHIFSTNAYPKKHPEAKAICPICHDVFDTYYNQELLECRKGHNFSAKGIVNRSKFTCSCGNEVVIAKSLNSLKPKYNMFAKIVLNKRGKKIYEKIDNYDKDLFDKLSKEYLKIKDTIVQPEGELEPGVNTNQALNWGFKKWRDFFNVRQLYSLGIIASEIKKLSVTDETKEALFTLFSGVLEFNNLFCSFKGEGTGAVRHMFSNHILHPEKTPLEANPWGTSQSSGSFVSLFNSRIERTINYKESPFDLILDSNGKVEKVTIAKPYSKIIVQSWNEFVKNPNSHYVISGDSSSSDMPDNSIDLIITDPPYMDNVNYSELADFFHAWLKVMKPYKNYSSLPSTRDSAEVQSESSKEFEEAIQKVWAECQRVLKDEGLLIFTFHQAKIDGWLALVKSLKQAEFAITAIQPIKAEMSTSLVKSGIKEPNFFDSIIVCRKGHVSNVELNDIKLRSEKILKKLKQVSDNGIEVGVGDYKSIIRGIFLSAYTLNNNFTLNELAQHAEDEIENYKYLFS